MVWLFPIHTSMPRESRNVKFCRDIFMSQCCDYIHMMLACFLGTLNTPALCFNNFFGGMYFFYALVFQIITIVLNVYHKVCHFFFVYRYSKCIASKVIYVMFVIDCNACIALYSWWIVALLKTDWCQWMWWYNDVWSSLVWLFMLFCFLLANSGQLGLLFATAFPFPVSTFVLENLTVCSSWQMCLWHFLMLVPVCAEGY